VERAILRHHRLIRTGSDCHQEYAEGVEKILRTCSRLDGKQVLARGTVREAGPGILFEITEINAFPSPLYRLRVPDDRAADSPWEFLPPPGPCRFEVEIANPLTESLHEISAHLEPEQPGLLNIKTVTALHLDSLPPGGRCVLGWEIETPEPWRQRLTIRLSSPHDPVLAETQDVWLLQGWTEEHRRNMTEVVRASNRLTRELGTSALPYERLRETVRANPPPSEFKALHREAIALLEGDAFVADFMAPVSMLGVVIAPRWVGDGPAEVRFDLDLNAVEILYRKGHLAGYRRARTDRKAARGIAGLVTPEKAIEISREWKGGSGSFVYRYAVARLFESRRPGKEPSYLWEVAYHLRTGLASAMTNQLCDYIDARTGKLLEGLVAVQVDA
jgi:hypothetical protein